MAKRLAPDSASKELASAEKQSGLSERMRELIVRSSTVEDRRNGEDARAFGRRRRRTDDTNKKSES
jgi:hypothetical protein